jgi:stage II sporulation protein E
MIFDGVGGKKYMVLCDGMGSGENAREASSTSVSFLKEIISVSTDVEIALTMLGSLLRARAIEYSTTVDILEIDLNTGKGSVIKCGASPTYIKRGDKVFKLQSKTMPLGILKELDAEESSFEIARGDICIMISDGVADSKNDEKIVKLISEFNGNIDTLAYKIIEKAKKQLGQNDDMTVLVTEICAN